MYLAVITSPENHKKLDRYKQITKQLTLAEGLTDAQARALAQEPEFVVLDEPTASLDFGNQGRVMREITALAASGHGVLFTTHDPNHAMRAADRAFLLRQGVCIAAGDVRSVLERDRLEALYGAKIVRIEDRGSDESAFLPG